RCRSIAGLSKIGQRGGVESARSDQDTDAMPPSKVAGPVNECGRSLDFAASTAVACLRFVMSEHLLAIPAIPRPHQGAAPPARFRPSGFRLPGRGLFGPRLAGSLPARRL